MKKHLLLFVVMTTFLCSNGQDLDSLQIIERSKELFKILQVDLKFKDPYSYELLKIEADPVSLREKLEFDLGTLKRVKSMLVLDTTSSYSDFAKNKKIFDKQSKILAKGEKLKDKNYDKYLEKYSIDISLHAASLKALNSHRKLIDKAENDISIKGEMLSDQTIDLSKIAQWSISLDCYGANSYGNKILGRYIFRVSSEGKLEGEIIKIN